MKKHLLNSGGSWYTYLSKPVMQLLCIDPQKSKLLFTVKGDVLYIREVFDHEIQKLQNPLIKKLTRKGSGYSIYISFYVLEIMNINPEVDMVEISVEDKTLIIKKAV